MKVFVAVLFAAAVTSVSCLSTGPPQQACEPLSPPTADPPAGHGVVGQNTTSPYCVNVLPFLGADGTTYSYIPGCTYYLSFLGCSSSDPSRPNTETPYQYRGFFVQSRLADDTRVGTFSVFGTTETSNDFSQLSRCPNRTDGITHIEPSLKTCSVFGWIAPEAGTGDLYFRFAGVRMRTEYWAAQAQLERITEGTGTAPDDCPTPFNLRMLCDGAIGTVSTLTVLLVSLVLALML